jgi:vacuolar-type H+-ATPase subunit I/STV1
MLLMVVQLLYDALFIFGLIEGWDQTFLSFIIGMAMLTFGLMLDLYRRSFLPDVLETKRRRDKVVPRLER